MAQHYWPQAQVDEIFNILYTQGAREAVVEVESEDITTTLKKSSWNQKKVDTYVITE